MQISSEAVELMSVFGERYIASNYANLVQLSTGDDAVLHELRAVGLIKRLGTRGAPWVFTPIGIQWVMDHRQAS